MEDSKKVMAVLFICVLSAIIILSRDMRYYVSSVSSRIILRKEADDLIDIFESNQAIEEFDGETNYNFQGAIDPIEEIQGSESISQAQFYMNNDNVSVRLWDWRKQNILFIKIPKTGGTTMAENLARLANHTRWMVARAVTKASVDTCAADEEAEVAWSRAANFNGGRFHIFALHACYKPFMRSRKYWSLRRAPFTITLLRNPWEHYVSKYRFAKLCCQRSDWKWCDSLCPKDANGDRHPLSSTYYFDKVCKIGRCSEQRYYLGSGMAAKILNEFDLVLILERFDESLALLALKAGLPFEALPYLPENHNELNKVPDFTDETRKMIQSTVLAPDFNLYKNAEARLDQMIASLSPEEKEQFDALKVKISKANGILQDVCGRECGHLVTISRERKTCHQQCIERVLDQY